MRRAASLGWATGILGAWASLALAGCADPEVPDIAYCDDVADWDEAAAASEEEVLELVNQRRAAGASCGGAGSFAPAPALTMNASLRCAARKHSQDMVDRDYFAHTSPDGGSPADRIAAAEYSYSTWGENIAGGSATAAGVVDQWMGSDGHCSNIMSPAFTELGVGYVAGGAYGHTWTQVFGAP
ncbi:MAG: CAP domain-containing protein [Nannocystaceae bacterium]